MTMKKSESLSTFDLFKHLESGNTVSVSDEELKLMQEYLTDMLEDISTVCEENGFFYTLGGGSALGAVRHHGFIPWDDDVDVNMPRKDLAGFTARMEEKFPDKYWVRTPQKTDNYGLLMVQIRRKGTSVRTRDDYWNEECGLSIDVFPVENTYDNRFLRLVHEVGCYYYGFAVSCRKFYRDREWLNSLAEGNEQVKSVFGKKILIGQLLSWRSLDQWVRKADRWYSMCKDEHSKMVVIPSGRKHFKELYLRSDLLESVMSPFGKLTVRIPKGFDFYLTKLYNDYMKLPKKEDIEQHKYYKPFVL